MQVTDVTIYVFHDIERVFAGKRRVKQINHPQKHSEFIHDECEESDNDDDGKVRLP